MRTDPARPALVEHYAVGRPPGVPQAVLARIRLRKAGHSVFSTRLVVNKYGCSVGVHAISERWRVACKAAGVAGKQLRDIRAKAGTDKTESAGDIRQAQQLLGTAR